MPDRRTGCGPLAMGSRSSAVGAASAEPATWMAALDGAACGKYIVRSRDLSNTWRGGGGPGRGATDPRRSEAILGSKASAGGAEQYAMHRVLVGAGRGFQGLAHRTHVNLELGVVALTAACSDAGRSKQGHGQARASTGYSQSDACWSIRPGKAHDRNRLQIP